MTADALSILCWLKVGQKKKATHMIVVCDPVNFDDSPVYVFPDENVREVEKKQKENGYRIMEVYNLNLSLDDQMKEFRAFHY